MTEEQRAAEQLHTQQHWKLLNELSSLGAMWIDVEQYADDDWRLAEYAVVHVERDTNAAITDRVGEADDDDTEETYATEQAALEAALRLNQARLDYEVKNPGYYTYIPAGLEP